MIPIIFISGWLFNFVHPYVFNYHPSEIELSNKSSEKELPKQDNKVLDEPISNPEFKIGDIVQLKDFKDMPKGYPIYGSGHVKPLDIGDIIQIKSDGTIKVNFPSQSWFSVRENEIHHYKEPEPVGIMEKYKGELDDYQFLTPEYPTHKYVIVDTVNAITPTQKIGRVNRSEEKVDKPKRKLLL